MTSVAVYDSPSRLHNPNMDERQLAKQALESAEESLRSLCQEYSTTFVSIERRGVALQSSLERLVQELDQTTHDRVSHVRNELRTTNEDYEKSSAAIQLLNISQTHQQRRRTLLQHSTLLELLELPNVMDACIRSDLYDEALNIAAFANTLERRHDIADGKRKVTAGGATVIAAVVEEIRSREIELRQYLIQRFTKDITMPQCLELVTALRRLNGIELERASGNPRGGSVIRFPTVSSSSLSSRGGDLEGAHSAMELRLQVDFLEARDKWLEKNDVATTTTTGTSSSSSAAQQQNEQFLDWIERHRTKCFEVATQFLAIFCTSISSQDLTGSRSTAALSIEQTSHSLLSIWCARRIQLFLSTLENHLDTPSALTYTSISALRDALDATTFFAASMGRIGCDFTPLLSSIFESRVVRIVTQMWEDGVESLSETLRICREAGVASPLVNTSILFGSDVGKDASGGQQQHQAEEDSHPDGVETVNAPRSLLAYPPLARFVNAYLTGLNDLRRCLLPGTFSSLRSHLTSTVLPSLKVVLETNERMLLTPGMLRGDAMQLRQLATQYKEVLMEVVEPFVMEALNIAIGYPSKKKEIAGTQQEGSLIKNEHEESKEVSVPDENPCDDGCDDNNIGEHNEEEERVQVEDAGDEFDENVRKDHVAVQDSAADEEANHVTAEEVVAEEEQGDEEEEELTDFDHSSR